MTQRSIGVTVLAGLFILAGLGRLTGSLMHLVAGPHIVEQQVAQIQTQVNAAVTNPEQKQLSGERRARMQEKLNTAIAALRSFSTLPLVRFRFILFGMLGLALVIGGVGVLALYPWARAIILWQAGLAIVCTVAFIWLVPPSAALAEATLELVEDPAAQRQMQELIHRSQMMVVLISAGMEVAWNGFVLWFFNRSGVRAQFQPGSVR
jgi:hypothetical protein